MTVFPAASLRVPSIAHYIINVGTETDHKYIFFNPLSTFHLRRYLLLILKLVGFSLSFTDSSNRIFLPTGIRISISTCCPRNCCLYQWHNHLPDLIHCPLNKRCIVFFPHALMLLLLFFQTVFLHRNIISRIFTCIDIKSYS
jgi:hypothetical protein